MQNRDHAAGDLWGRLQRIEDQYEIRHLHSLYCQFLDDGDAQPFADLFVEDGELQPWDAHARGRAAILEWFRVTSPSDGERFRHLAMNHVARVDTDGVTASARADVIVIFPSPVRVVLAGRYIDALRRTADGWKFVSRRVEIPHKTSWIARELLEE